LIGIYTFDHAGNKTPKSAILLIYQVWEAPVPTPAFPVTVKIDT